MECIYYAIRAEADESESLKFSKELFGRS